jgi:hypothetical protein
LCATVDDAICTIVRSLVIDRRFRRILRLVSIFESFGLHFSRSEADYLSDFLVSSLSSMSISSCGTSGECATQFSLQIDSQFVGEQ